MTDDQRTSLELPSGLNGKGIIKTTEVALRFDNGHERDDAKSRNMQISSADVRPTSGI